MTCAVAIDRGQSQSPPYRTSSPRSGHDDDPRRRRSRTARWRPVPWQFCV